MFIKSLLSMLGICRHERHTWPLSVLNGREVAPYVTCLNCGKEFLYDVERMQAGTEIKRTVTRQTPDPVEVVTVGEIVDIDDLRSVHVGHTN